MANKYFFDNIMKQSATRNKKELFKNYLFYQLCRTQAMFQYTGLPETIPQRMLELYLQTNGFVVFAEYDGELYIYGEGVGLGGAPDVYYRPTIATIANPAQSRRKQTLRIGVDCEVMLNDSYLMGLMPMNCRYADLLTENTVTMRVANVNMRKTALITAGDDSTKKEAEKYQKDIEAGETSIPLDNEFVNGISVQPIAAVGQSRTMTELIEYQQYLLGGWYNELGIDSAFNMKRERLSEAESDQNIESTIPFAIDMLNNRREALERVNAHFGTNISVDFASVWRGLDDVTSETVDNTDDTQNTDNEEGNNDADN